MKLLIDPRALAELEGAAEFYRNERSTLRPLAHRFAGLVVGSSFAGFLTASSITSPETSCALSPSPISAAGRTTGSGDKPP